MDTQNNDTEKIQAAPTVKDLPWIIISLVVWITSFILFASWKQDVVLDDAFLELLSSLIVSTVVASLLGFLWVGVIRKLKSSIIKISLVATPVIYVVWGVYIMIEWEGNGIPYFVVAALYAIWGYWQRARIPFVTALLDAGTSALVDLPGLLWIQIASIMLNLGWAVFYMFFIVFGYNYVLPSTSNEWMSYLLTCWALYTMCTAINTFTSHVIACGAVATWWLTPQSGSPICDTTTRTVKYSFGSISLGAFVVTILETISFLIGWFFDLPCLRWCWKIFKEMIKLFSSYAFVRVAVYGDSFCEGAQATKDLFNAKGMDGITSDTFMWGVIQLGAWLLGAVHGGITILIMMAYGYVTVDTDMFVLYLLWLLGLMIGKAMISATLQPIESAVRTTFVLWATPGSEATMLQNHQELMQAILDNAVGPYALQTAQPVQIQGNAV